MAEIFIGCLTHPVSKEDYDQLVELCPLDLVDSAKREETARLLLQSIPLETILEGAFQTDNEWMSVTYFHFLITAARLREVSPNLVKSPQFWLNINSVLENFDYRINLNDIHYKAAAFAIRALTTGMRKKYIDVVISNFSLSSLLQVLRRKYHRNEEDMLVKLTTAAELIHLFTEFVNAIILNTSADDRIIYWLHDSDSGINAMGSLMSGQAYKMLYDAKTRADEIQENGEARKMFYRAATCHYCKKKETGKKKMKYCSRCKSVLYCNGKCQKAAWKRHKKICKKLKL